MLANREPAFVWIGNTVKYRLSTHAQEEIEHRKIPQGLVESVIEKPDQIVLERGSLKAYQSKRDIGGKMFPVRVIIDDGVDPAVVVTSYKTTKIEKYWKNT
jgi:hypothetical protein